MSVHYLETFSNDPCYNLAFEELVLRTRVDGDWLILWQNANTIVVGLNQNTKEEINRPFVEAHGITVVRRTTGGGAVYHDMGNLNYSFISDLGDAQTLTMERFTQPVCKVLTQMGATAEASGRNDITVNDKKVSGVAQRILGKRILHHGTLLFDSDAAMISGALRADPAKFSSKSAKSVRSRVGNIRTELSKDMALPEFWARLRDALTADGMVREQLSAEELESIQRSAGEKYRSWDWNFGRSPEYGFKNRLRFPGGTLEARLDVRDGCIQAATFHGDFMAVSDCAPAEAALVGIRFERNDVSGALDGLDIAAMFGGITADDILTVMFGEEDIET